MRWQVGIAQNFFLQRGQLELTGMVYLYEMKLIVLTPRSRSHSSPRHTPLIHCRGIRKQVFDGRVYECGCKSPECFA